MPEIKIADPTLAPSYKVPKIGVEQKGVDRAQPHRPVSSGKDILAQIYGDVSKGVGDMAKYMAVYEVNSAKRMNRVEVSNRIADMENNLNQHYVDNIVPRKSGAAKNLFRDEIEVIEGMKRTALQEVEGDERLQQMLSFEFDKLAQRHLKKVFDHKVKQDNVYREDTAVKVAKNLQTEMSMLGLKDSGRAIGIINEMDTQLTDYPILRDTAMIGAWKGFFKFNARIAPELTQKSYENKTMRKSIVSQIGSEGYSNIQEAIDKGRAIGIQDAALAKQQAKEVKAEQTESLMMGAMHTVFSTPENFTANYIDKLGTEHGLPSTQQRILRNLLASLTTKKLQDAEVDWNTYRFHLEQVRSAKALGLSAIGVGDEIIKDINREITVEQGQSLLKALASRDVFDKPLIDAAYADLEKQFQYAQTFEDWTEYGQAVRGLTEIVISSDGDPEKVQEYMDRIVRPLERTGFLKALFTGTPMPLEFRPSPTLPYATPEEIEEINKLIDQEYPGRTIDDLTPESFEAMLNSVKNLYKYRRIK